GFSASTANIAWQGHQNTFGGILDAILVKFNPSGMLLWATYLGGAGIEYAWDSAVDAFGSVYMAGYTTSTTNISLSGHQDSLSGLSDAFLVKFCDGPPQPSAISGDTLLC